MDTTALKNRLGNRVQEIGEAASQQVAVVTTQPMAEVNSKYIALRNNAMDIIRENLKHQPLTLQLFDIVKSPSGGATVFSVPGLAGDEAVKELVGIIMDYQTPRAYWDTPDPVEGTPPVCYSPDSLMSSDKKPCAHCPLNTFGSKDGDSNAKACKEFVTLFLLRPDNIMPIVVRVPVTSKILFQRYTTRLTGKLMPLPSVVTKISLEKATSKGGKPYALFNFEVAEVLSPEEAAQAKAFSQQFMEIVAAAEIEPVFSEAS